MEKHRKPDGNYDGVGVFSELTGMPEPKVRSVLQQVQENHRKLNSCDYHEFDQSPQTGMMRSITHQKYICRHCGGEVDYTFWHWHEMGRRQKPQQEE